jgi:hypothetical protein
MNMRIYMDCLWNGGCELLIGTITSTYLPYIQIRPFVTKIKRTSIYELMKDIQFKQGFESYIRRTESLDLLLV